MNRIALVFFLVLFASNASAFSYATGGCADGCAEGEQWLYTNANEIDDALDAIQTLNATQTSDIASLTSSLADYLPLAGGDLTGTVNFQTGAIMWILSGATLLPQGTGSIRATQMSATGQIDDDDLAASAVDGGTGGEIQDGTISAADILDGSITGTDILNDTVALTTDTSGDYVATVTGDTEITVSGSGTEGRAVTLAVASALTRDTELALKSAETSTVNNVPKFSDTTGNLVDSLLTVADTSGNVTTPGSLNAGGSTGASTFIMRNMADSGWVECGVNTTTFSCATDADGVADGTL